MHPLLPKHLRLHRSGPVSPYSSPAELTLGASPRISGKGVYSTAAQALSTGAL